MSHELSLADVAAVNGGGMGEMWNNPFIYLVWLAVLGGGNGFFGRGAGCVGAPSYRQSQCGYRAGSSL